MKKRFVLSLLSFVLLSSCSNNIQDDSSVQETESVQEITDDEYFGYKVDEAGWKRAFSDEVLSNHTRNYYFGVTDSIESTIVNKIDNNRISFKGGVIDYDNQKEELIRDVFLFEDSKIRSYNNDIGRYQQENIEPIDNFSGRLSFANNYINNKLGNLFSFDFSFNYRDFSYAEGKYSYLSEHDGIKDECTIEFFGKKIYKISKLVTKREGSKVVINAVKCEFSDYGNTSISYIPSIPPAQEEQCNIEKEEASESIDNIISSFKKDNPEYSSNYMYVHYRTQDSYHYMTYHKDREEKIISQIEKYDFSKCDSNIDYNNNEEYKSNSCVTVYKVYYFIEFDMVKNQNIMNSKYFRYYLYSNNDIILRIGDDTYLTHASDDFYENMSQIITTYLSREIHMEHVFPLLYDDVF